MVADAARVGVLAVQGGFEAHAKALIAIGCDVLEVRRPEQLDQIEALVLPGGESTTISKGMADYSLRDPVREFVAARNPVMATCAGLILLDDRHLGLLDVSTKRNAYGRQLSSFEAPVEIDGLGSRPFEAVFIRAPRIERAGVEVEVLARHDGDAVVVRQGRMLACSFHPELTEDRRLHEAFVEMIRSDNSIEVGVTP